MRHIIPISGKDSLATALVQTTRAPELPYEFLFCDVRAELPEVYEWLDVVEAKTGWRIVRVGKSLIETISDRGGFLPSPQVRYCTSECKIKPMESFIGKDEATIYYGLRADEVRKGYVPVKGSSITPSYPLQDFGVDLRGVYAILDAQELSPPTFFWLNLHRRVSQILSSSGWADWETRLTRSEHQSLFSGRSRGNCFFCFFQRQYEFAWLYETHRDLFMIAQGMEKDDYTFKRDHAMADYNDDGWRESIVSDRAKDVARVIAQKFQTRMFEFQEGEIALTSCGLLCGK